MEKRLVSIDQPPGGSTGPSFVVQFLFIEKSQNCHYNCVDYFINQNLIVSKFSQKLLKFQGLQNLCVFFSLPLVFAELLTILQF
jgi:hypothetical protein